MSRREREGLKSISDRAFDKIVQETEKDYINLGLVDVDAHLASFDADDRRAERAARDAEEAKLPEDVRKQNRYKKHRKEVRLHMDHYKYGGNKDSLNSALVGAGGLTVKPHTREEVLERAKWAKEVLDAQRPAPSMWEWAVDKLKGGR